MIDLPDRLRAIADSLAGDEWEHPLCAERDCRRAADEIERLTADNTALRVDLEGEANWDTLCLVASRLTEATGAPMGMSLPEQVEHGLAAVKRLQDVLGEWVQQADLGDIDGVDLGLIVRSEELLEAAEAAGENNEAA